MTHPVPSARAQLDFIQQLRRLLDEGSFVATYKYARLHAIADLCVTQGEDSGAPKRKLIWRKSESFETRAYPPVRARSQTS